jgi:hypothetical protein
MNPAMIIGVGTSGLRILEHLQQFMFEIYGEKLVYEAKNNGIVLINIETNKNEVPSETPAGNLVEKIDATVQDLNHARKVLQTRGKGSSSWIPENLSEFFASKGISAGAGNKRAVGRLALWEEENFFKIYNKLKESYDIISQKKADSHIIVTGTLTGGTCSGMEIDISYITRQFSLNKAILTGLFLVPQQNLEAKDYPLYANCWATLKDLEYFRDDKTSYDYVWPNGGKCDEDYRKLPPYGAVYLLSTQFQKVAPFTPLYRLEYLYYLCGLFLFCFICGLAESLEKIRCDANVPSYLRSFGISGISYPKYLITELAACDLAINWCNRLLNEEKYLPKGADKEYPIEKSQIAKSAEEFFDKEISSLADQLGSSISGGKSLKDEIKDLARDWEKGEVKEDEIRKKFKFVAGEYKNIYSQVSDYKSTLEERLLETIKKETDSNLEYNENLKYTTIFLERLTDYKDDLLSLWKKQGLGENTQELNKAIDEEVLEKRGALATDRAGRNEDAIWALADKTKMFFLYQVLKSVDLSQGSRVGSHFTHEELVKVKDGIIKMKNEIGERRGVLEKMLTAPNMPIKMIWRNGSFEKDLKDMENLFKNVSYRDLDVVGKEPLSQFLRKVKIEDGKPKDQYAWSHLISLFQNWINRKIPGDTDIRIIDLIEKENIKNLEFAERAKSLLLPLDQGGLTSNAERGVPAVMLHKSEVDMVSLREKGGLGEFAPCVLKELSHSMLFLQEQIGISPLTDLIHRKDMERARFYIVKDAYGKDTISPKRWEELMDPYEVEKAKIRPKVQKLVEVILNLAIEWEVDPKMGRLKPVGSNLPSIVVDVKKEEILFKIDGKNEITVGLKEYAEIKGILQSTLERNIAFLEQITSWLIKWKLDDTIFNKSRDRWRQMNYDEDEIEKFEADYKDLASYFQKEKEND